MRKSMCVERTAGRAGKRLISSALAILMCLSLVPATPKAAGPTAKQLPVTQPVLTTEVNRKSRSEEPSATEVKVPEAQAKSAGKAVEAVAPSTAPDRIDETADQDSVEPTLPEHTGVAHPSGKASSVSTATEPPTSDRAENKVADSTLKQAKPRSGSVLPLEPAALAEVPADGAYTVPVALRNHKYQGALSSNASVEVEGGQVKSAKLQFHGFSLGDKYTHLKGFVWPGAELADPEVEADLSAPFYVEQEYPPQEGDFRGGTEAFTQTVELRNLALSAQGLAQAVSYKDPVTGEQVADFVDFDFASSYCRPTESIEKADWIMLQCNIAGYLGAVSKYLGRDADKRFEADSLRVFRSTLGDLEANIREESLSYEELYEFLSSAYEASCHLKILVDPAGLADGKYKLPVKLMHAYNDGQASMGNGAVVQTAVAEVKDGKADLYIQMQGLHFLGMYGHLWNMFQWQDDGTGQDPYAFKGKTVAVETIRTGADSSLMDDMMDFPEVLKLKNCDVQKAYVPVMVWVDAMDAIQSEDSSSYKTIQKGKGAQNAKLTPDWSKAEKIAEGRDLQSVLGIAGAQTYIASAKTDLSAYSQKTAVAYKNSLEALKAIVAEDSADANKIYETIQDFKVKRHGLVEARKEELKDLLDRAGQLVKSDYTEDSWNKLSEAMKDGKQIYYAARSSDADIAQAVAGLKEALAGLQKLVDKSKLEAKLNEVAQLNEADYTEASWQVLQQAVKAAKAVQSDPAATVDQVNQQVDALTKAVKDLVKKPQVLADGKYKIPVKLMHAYNDGQASMGNGAVVQTAVAEVKDGKADLYIQMQGLHFLGMYGHLWNMFQWQDDGTGQDPYAFKGKTVAVETIRTGADSSLMDDMMDFPEVLKLKNCDVQKAYVPVMVWVDAMDAIQSEDSSSYKTIQKGKGAQNAKLTPDWSKAEKIAEGRDLQSVLGIAGAQTYIASAKTDLSAYSQKTAVAYKNSLEALKAIVAEDSADANKIYETIQDFKVKRHGLVEARKEELKDLLDRAGQLVKSDYTEDSWNKLSEAMKDGKQIYYAARSSDADIAQAVAGLKEALAGLQKLVDKSKLEAKLTEAKALAEADYTEASWQVLQQAVAKAEGVKQDAAATADEVAQAVAALEQAITALKEKSTLIQPTLVSVDHAPTKWTLNVPGQNFVLKVNSDLANLVSVKVNGQILAAAAYTAASGSTVITLQPVYLNSLAPGPYTLTMTYKEGGDFAAGEVEHAFTVLPEPVDKSALVAKINEAKALVEADYTEASWQALQTALVKAEAVNQAADVTADQVAAEVSGLDRAIKSLVQKTAPAPGTTTTTTTATTAGTSQPTTTTTATTAGTGQPTTTTTATTAGTSQPTTTTTATTAGTGQPTATTTATKAGTGQPTATTKPGGPTSQGPSATKPGPKAPEANKPGKPGLARTGQAMTSVYLVCGLTVLAVGAFALKKRRQD